MEALEQAGLWRYSAWTLQEGTACAAVGRCSLWHCGKAIAARGPWAVQRGTAEGLLLGQQCCAQR